jgi:hypothetical protein
LKILYYTSGLSGSGRIIQGISIFNSLKRKNINCEFIILSSSTVANLCDFFNINHIEIPPEKQHELTKETYSSSNLFQTISTLNPDVLLIDRMWFTLINFIEQFNCKKIFLCGQVPDRFFSIISTDEIINFNRKQFDKVFAIEPFFSSIPMEKINPLLIRNKDEIYDKETALRKLNLNGQKNICLMAVNAYPDQINYLFKKYSYIKDQGYEIINTTNMTGGGIFPVVDYFNAFDLIICGAGYNQFWEVIYFNKEAIFEPIQGVFGDQRIRVQNCQEYYFEENGADQLVDIIMNL